MMAVDESNIDDTPPAAPVSNTEVFIRVLAYANIAREFYDEILDPSRYRNFRQIMSLDQAQEDEIIALAAATGSRGIKADSLQLMKLIRSADHYKAVRNVLVVPWNTFTEDMTLDMIEDYVLYKPVIPS